MGYAKNNTALALYILGSALNTVYFSSLYLNGTDMAPYHAGALMGVANGLGGFSAIISPIVAGVLLDHGNCDTENNVSQPHSCLLAWRIIFSICSFMLCAAVILFGFFGTSAIVVSRSGLKINETRRIST